MKFDSYTIQARILPSLILLLPLFIEFNLMAVKIGINIATILPIGNIGLIALLFVCAHAIRYYGSKKQKQLFDNWGGAPTTQFLRWSNKESNVESKKQIRRSLKMIFNGLKMPTEEYEREFPAKADEVYDAYAQNLRELTRDGKKFPLVHAENRNYGMWRNLFAIRFFALLLTSLIIVANLFLAIFCADILSWEEFGVLSAVFSVFIIIWIIVVKESKIRHVAECYAERLFGAAILLKNK